MSRLDNNIRKAVHQLLEGVGLAWVVLFAIGLSTAINSISPAVTPVGETSYASWQIIFGTTLAFWMLWAVPMRLIRPFMVLMDRVETNEDMWVILRKVVEASAVRAAIVVTLFLPALMLTDPPSKAFAFVLVFVIVDRLDTVSLPLTLKSLDRSLPAA